jgi:hypothetical protein
MLQNIRVNEQGISEEWFFTLLFSNDLWTVFKKYMYPNKKSSNFDNYRNGDCAVFHGYYFLIIANNKLVFNYNSMKLAIVNRHLDIVKYLYDSKKLEINKVHMLHNAAYYGPKIFSP